VSQDACCNRILSKGFGAHRKLFHQTIDESITQPLYHSLFLRRKTWKLCYGERILDLVRLHGQSVKARKSFGNRHHW
jgi:hypothetical protein